MNTLPTNAETADELDRLFSGYLKGQLKQPWPKAPVPAGAAKTAEPSELAAARAAEAPRNTPTPAAKGRDNTARARFTLAASVALMLGTCWYLSNGFEPGSRPGQATPPATGPGMLQNGGADGNQDPRLKKIGEDKAKGDNGAPKIDMGQFE